MKYVFHSLKISAVMISFLHLLLRGQMRQMWCPCTLWKWKMCLRWRILWRRNTRRVFPCWRYVAATNKKHKGSSFIKKNWQNNCLISCFYFLFGLCWFFVFYFLHITTFSIAVWKFSSPVLGSCFQKRPLSNQTVPVRYKNMAAVWLFWNTNMPAIIHVIALNVSSGNNQRLRSAVSFVLLFFQRPTQGTVCLIRVNMADHVSKSLMDIGVSAHPTMGEKTASSPSVSQ